MAASESIPMLGLGPIILCLVVHMGLGALWYSPLLFFHAWERLAFPNRKCVDNPIAMYVMVAGAAMHAPLVCFLLAAVGVRDANEGVLWGLFLALFDVALNLCNGFFNARPFGIFLISRSYHAVSLIVSGGLLGALYGS